MHRNRRLLLAALMSLLLPVTSRADVVGPCPPLFDASHSGCHLEPSRSELYIVGGVVLFALLSTVVLLAFASAKDRKKPE